MQKDEEAALAAMVARYGRSKVAESLQKSPNRRHGRPSEPAWIAGMVGGLVLLVKAARGLPSIRKAAELTALHLKPATRGGRAQGMACPPETARKWASKPSAVDCLGLVATTLLHLPQPTHTIGNLRLDAAIFRELREFLVSREEAIKAAVPPWARLGLPSVPAECLLPSSAWPPILAGRSVAGNMESASQQFPWPFGYSPFGYSLRGGGLLGGKIG